jgi:hypothetical protein
VEVSGTRTADPLHAKQEVEGFSNLIGCTTKIATADFCSAIKGVHCSQVFTDVRPCSAARWCFGGGVFRVQPLHRGSLHPKRDVSVYVQGHPTRTPSHAMRSDEHILAPFYCKNIRCMTEGMEFQITDYRLRPCAQGPFRVREMEQLFRGGRCGYILLEAYFVAPGDAKNAAVMHNFQTFFVALGAFSLLRFPVQLAYRQIEQAAEARSDTLALRSDTLNVAIAIKELTLELRKRNEPAPIDVSVNLGVAQFTKAVAPLGQIPAAMVTGVGPRLMEL